MATFKVGQRVRVIGGSGRETRCLGREGTVISVQALIGVMVDGIPCEVAPGTHWLWHAHELAPLTDPKADEFIERVKKWKPEPEIVAPKQPVNVA